MAKFTKGQTVWHSKTGHPAEVLSVGQFSLRVRYEGGLVVSLTFDKALTADPATRPADPLRLAPAGAVRSRWSVELPRRKGWTMREVMRELAGLLVETGDVTAGEQLNQAAMALSLESLALLFEATQGAKPFEGELP